MTDEVAPGRAGTAGLGRRASARRASAHGDSVAATPGAASGNPATPIVGPMATMASYRSRPLPVGAAGERDDAAGSVTGRFGGRVGHGHAWSSASPPDDRRRTATK